MPTRPLAYVIESRMTAGAFVGFVIVKCSVCKKTTELKWPGHHNPNHIAKHFNRMGWDFNSYRTGNKCPTCNKPAQLTGPSGPDFSSFGKRLRWTREQVHVGRDLLADEANIPRLLIEHLEADTAANGLFKLEDTTAAKLAEALTHHGAVIDMNWLIGKTQKTNTSSVRLAVRLQALMDKYSYTEGSLASATGVPLTDIKSMLSGHLQTHYKIGKIAAVLHSSVSYLVGDIDKAARVLPVNPPPVPAIEAVAEPIATKPVRSAKPLASPVVQSFSPGLDLRKMREDKGVTQGDLSRMIAARDDVPWKSGSIQSMLSKIERGHPDVVRMACRDRLVLMSVSLLTDAEPVKAAPEPSKIKDIATVRQAVVPVIPEKVNLPALPDTGLEADLRKAINDLGDLKTMAGELTATANDLTQKAVEIMNDLRPLYQMIADTAGRVEAIQSQMTQKKSEKPTKELLAPIPLVMPHRGEHLKFIGGMWIYRRTVPKYARDVFGLWEVKKKLATADLAVARKLKRPFERAFEKKLYEVEVEAP